MGADEKNSDDVSSEASVSSHDTPDSFREPQATEEQVEVVHVSPHRPKTGRSLMFGIMSQSPGGSTTTKILHSSTPTNSFNSARSANNSTAPTSPSSTFIPRVPPVPPVETVVQPSIQPSPSSEAFVIDEGTPAYDALKANADVKVTKVDKFFRGIQAQNVWYVAKKATLKSKSGNVRGKPPRVPPGFMESGAAIDPDPDTKAGLNRVEEGHDEDEEEDDTTRPLLSPKEEQDKLKAAAAAGAAAAKKAPFEGDGLTGYEEASKQGTELHGVMPPLLPILDDESTIQGPPSVSTSIRLFTKIPSMVGPAISDSKGIEHHKLFSERRRRRRKAKQTKKDIRASYVKGKVIDGQHELYTLSIAVMLGLRTSIKNTNKLLSAGDLDVGGKRRWLDSDDFMSVEKYVFRPSGGPKTPAHALSHTFKFKDYSPVAFAYMRRMFGINEYDFLASVCGNANFIEFISNAKSGQFFFYSRDGKYMIKTMTNAESKFLRRILPHYFRHCSQNPNTLITKFLGMYRVKMYHLRRNVKFVIMNSVFDTDKVLQSFYDLKGSVIGREAKPNEDVKKDNDVRAALPDSAFALPAPVRERLRDQIERDCTFFKEMKIMDYSMLVGVHHIPSKQYQVGSAPRGLSFRSAKKLQGGGSVSSALSKRNMQGSTAGSSKQAPSSKSKTEPKPKNPLVLTSMGSEDTMAITNKNSKTTTMDEDPPRQRLRSLSVMSDMFPDDEDKASVGHKIRQSSAKERVLPSPSSSAARGMSLSQRPGYGNTVVSHIPPNPYAHSLDGDGSVASFTSRSTFDHMFDDDDDNSFLPKEENEGSDLNDPHRSTSTIMEWRKERATEQMYWPFHRFYDIRGRRRMEPMRSAAESAPESRHEGRMISWQIPNFDPPISNRKDAGFLMDTEHIKLPLAIYANTEKGPQYCDGKIFYMGIIDVLQQFNVRKRVEAKWRRIHGAGWKDASCIHPNLYADRFLQFFDEYAQRDLNLLEMGDINSEDHSYYNGVEVVTFEKEGDESLPLLVHDKGNGLSKPLSTSTIASSGKTSLRPKATEKEKLKEGKKNV